MDGTAQALAYFEENRATCFTAIFATLGPAQQLYDNFVRERVSTSSNINALRDQAALMLRLLRELNTVLTASPYMAYMAAFSGISGWKRLSGRLQTALWRLEFTEPKLHNATELRCLLQRRLCLVRGLLGLAAAVYRSARKAHTNAPAEDGPLPELPEVPEFVSAEGSGGGSSPRVTGGGGEGSSAASSGVAALSSLAALHALLRR